VDNTNDLVRLKRENDRLRLALVKLREVLAVWQVDLTLLNVAGIRTMLRVTEQALRNE
jgi:hypothetical protein